MAKYSKLEPRTLTRAQKDRILEHYKYECQYCHFPAETVDHIIPFSWDQDDSENNLVACCWLCNLLASNLMFENFSRKRDYLLDKRYRYIISHEIPLWTRHEVDMLGERLKQKVVNECVILENDKERENCARRLLSEGWRVGTGNTWYTRRLMAIWRMSLVDGTYKDEI